MSGLESGKSPSAPPRSVLLWIVVLASPLAWFLYFSNAFFFTPLSCGHGGKTAAWIGAVLAIVVIVAAGASAWKYLQTPSTEPDPAHPRYSSNRRVMAWGGIGMSGLFLLVMLAQLIPNIMIGGCE